MSFITHFSRRFLNIPVYGGPYVNKGWAHKSKGPKDLEEAAGFYKKTLESEVTEPSPFHVVFRYKKGIIPWTIKVKLRHLGLHGKEIGYPVLIPNTPHFNALLWDVKHLIKLAPVTFPDGLPTEKDIGATRLCPFTGKFEINDKFRVDPSRVWADVPSDFYKGTI
ncbi:39S ribosomal protein L30, mitochondrial-like [Panonychus citri]|uniref:39S ribosomal protein L30, mitochondrial-like n=1 Tax=Panonychus citri TaxID=50023 RepID=UPI002307622F|nr:39S ribosomal protein L30, mitochondrial-like [Panonychus citri]